MRIYKVNGVEHTVFDPDDTLPDNIIIQSNWRDGQVGDWIKTDDDCVLEVLRRGKMVKKMGRIRLSSI